MSAQFNKAVDDNYIYEIGGNRGQQAKGAVAQSQAAVAAPSSTTTNL